MHGRLKVRTTAEEAVRKRKEQQTKVKIYRAAMRRIFEKRELNEFDDELLVSTGQVLSRNPDVYTLWNIRKECILAMGERLENEMKKNLFSSDLGFTAQCLMVNPKSYGAWYHRCWILENSETPDWNAELSLCNKYLKLDERNFHCWDYRRFVVRKSGVSPEDELNYCSEKIRNNFSNYSSWHYRSKLLPILYPHETNSSRPISEEKLKDELEMVLTAAFTDPNDSSAWFYQRWLLGYSQPPLSIAAVRISKNLATVAFSNPIDLNKVEVSTNFGIEFKSNGWRTIRKGTSHDNIWRIEGTFEVNASEQTDYTLNCKSSNGDNYTIELRRCYDGFYGINYPKFEYEFGTAVIDVLRNQLDSCNQLLEYEPDSKWTLLTSALLMRAIDRKEYHKASLEYLRKLETIDYLRKGYYADLASKWAIEKKLEDWIDMNDLTSPLDLSNINLTTVHYEQYMSIADTLILSYNDLMDRATGKFNAFQFCKRLNLAYNNLSTGGVPHLPNVVAISLEGNKFSDDSGSLNNKLN